MELSAIRGPISRVRAIAIVVGLIAAQAALAQDTKPARDDGPTQRPFLYLIEREPPAFLYGTIHLADARIMDVPDVVHEAYEASDALYTEIEMDLGAIGESTRTRMMLPAGKTLKDILPPALYERVDKFLKTRGTTIEAFKQFRVWAAAMQISLIDLMKDVQGFQGLDMYFYNLARSDEKKVGGIETITEQLDALECLSEDEQIKSLEKGIRVMEEHDAKGRRVARELLDSYHEGDETRLVGLMNEYMDPKDPIDAKMFDRLITQRDKRMAERIDELLKKNPQVSYTFAVGAYHLIGKDANVIKHLEKAGYKIRRLTPDDVARVKELRSKKKAASKAARP